MRPERFELPTCCSGGNRSIQLSYGRARVSTVYMGGGNSINVNVAPRHRKPKKMIVDRQRAHVEQQEQGLTSRHCGGK